MTVTNTRPQERIHFIGGTDEKVRNRKEQNTFNSISQTEIIREKEKNKQYLNPPGMKMTKLKESEHTSQYQPHM
jgi:hypothetical protein